MALQSGFVLFLGSSKLCTAFPIVDLNTSWSVAFFFEFHGNHHAMENSIVLGTILVFPLGCKSEVPKKRYSKCSCAKITTLGLLPTIARSRTGPK